MTESQGIQVLAKPRKDVTSVAACLDEVERGLSKALAEYRHHAEEVLIKHLECLEGLDRGHQLEVANLRAENGMLRDKLGLAKTADCSMFQTVMFSTDEKHLRKGQTHAKLLAEKRNLKEDNDTDKSLSVRKARGKNQEPPGGAWQQFVAWVPNGAALKSPEPWKPLAQAQLMQPDKPAGHPPLLGVVPGVVQAEENDGSESKDGSQVEGGKAQEFEVLSAWQASKHALDKMRRTSNNDGESRYTRERSLIQDEGDNFLEEPHNWVIHPHSRPRIVWDILSLAMVIYDMVTIPMLLFDLPEDDEFLLFMEWATRLFWTLDMGWSSVTAVVLEDGSVEYSHFFIIKRYLKTWFALDFLINGLDWTMTALSSSSETGFLGLARIFRIVRVVRLLRLVRMQEVVSMITERIQSDKMAFVLSMVKVMVFVLSTSHLIACIWWGIGARDTPGPTWVKGLQYENVGLDTKYLSSMHWSLTQFTGGMDEITPEDPIERFYANIVWVFAFMASSLIASTLTSNLTQLHIIGGARARQVATLRKYLNQNGISSNLALRVQRSAQHAINGELTEDSVELLTVVSEPLKIEMHFAMYTGVIRSHPFFVDFIQEAPNVVRKVCHFAVSTMLLVTSDVIFNKGDELEDPKMYWVWKGFLTYVNRYHEPVHVKEKHWIAEPAVWTRWWHRGTLTASMDAKLVCLDVKTFQDIANRHKYSAGFDPKLFAADFVDALNQTADVDDLTSICMRP